jgi:predicted RNA-binding protein with PIN domain
MVIVVDGANVVGARPDGWWKDRAGAARRLHEELMTADVDGDIVLVLEGQAKAGVAAGRDGHVTVVHAPSDGDSEIVRQAHLAADAGDQVMVVTADRLLSVRVAKAGPAVGPGWLLDRLGVRRGRPRG